MTDGTRTRVGIAEWARRARAARAVELRLADALGAAIASAPTGAEKIELARAARLHGWHAELWARVVPVLHDVDSDVDDDTLEAAAVTLRDDPQAGVEQTVEDLADRYRSWLAEATPIADAPTITVLRLILGSDSPVETV